MNLISCNSCGLVYDADRLIFPDLEELMERGAVSDTNSFYDGDKFTPILICNSCGGMLMKGKSDGGS